MPRRGSRQGRAGAAVFGADPTTLPWHEVSPAELERVRYEPLAGGAGPSSVNSAVLGVRGIAATGLSDGAFGHRWHESEEGRRRYYRLEGLRGVNLVCVRRFPPSSMALRLREFERLMGACLSERLRVMGALGL